MELVDTHAHLDLPEFERDLGEMVERAADAGVNSIICVGTTADSSRRCIELSRQFPGRLYAAVGIHPNHCAEARRGDFERIQALAQDPVAVAIGETGLDLHRGYAPPEVQLHSLREHLRLSAAVGKPVIIHARRADEEVLATLKEEPGWPGGVRHCFDGAAQLADAYVELGLHVAFGGLLTRPGYKRLKSAARTVPAGRLLVETDCPYMTPAGAGRARNEPALIWHTVRALAGIRDRSADEVADATTRNANRLFFGGGSF